MPTLVVRARRVVRTTGFAVLTGTFVPMFAARMRFAGPSGPSRRAVRDAWMGGWSRALLRLFAIQVRVDGDIPPITGGRVIVANHRSAIDIGAVQAVFGGEMLARHDLADWPVIGLGARTADTLFVNRTEANSGALAMRAVQRRLADGHLITIFPEGTTFDGDEVRPFHPGAFVAAIGAKAEVLPVGLAYPAASSAAYVNETFPQHLARLAGGAPTCVGIAVGRPIRAQPGERAAALAQRAQAEVVTLVARARALCGP